MGFGGEPGEPLRGRGGRWRAAAAAARRWRAGAGRQAGRQLLSMLLGPLGGTACRRVGVGSPPTPKRCTRLRRSPGDLAVRHVPHQPEHEPARPVNQSNAPA